MSTIKRKLHQGLPVFGGWTMIAHPTVMELYAAEWFDWVCIDMEHTSVSIREIHECILATKGTNVDVLVRLPSHEPSVAKRILDAGATGIIAPNVTTAEQAKHVVAMAKFPPEGNRGASLARCTDFGRNFNSYVENHNDNVVVVVMLEHVDALANLDAILSVQGIDATFVGPYDLSMSLGYPGQLNHPKVVASQKMILSACLKSGVPAGYHVVQSDKDVVQQRIDEGFRFIGCGLDTEFLVQGCRSMLPSPAATVTLDATVKQRVS